MELYSKRYSDFKSKCCKKVAELTELIQVLFVQNQEKDEIVKLLKLQFSELEYNLEAQIQLLKTDAQRNKISEQEKQYLVNELQSNFKEEEQQMREHYDEMLNVLKDQFNISLNEQNKIKKAYDSLKKQYDELNTNKTSYETKANEYIRDLEMKFEEKSNRLISVEQQLQHFNQERQLLKNDTRVKLEKLSSDNLRQDKQITGLIESNRQLRDKCKELEMQISVLNEEIRKSYQQKSIKSNSDNNNNDATNEILAPTKYTELERELTRYKMELSNRDKNYTKLFSSTPSTQFIPTNAFRVSNDSSTKQQSQQQRRRYSDSINGNRDFTVSMAKSQKHYFHNPPQMNLLKVVSAQYRDKDDRLPTLTK